MLLWDEIMWPRAPFTLAACDRYTGSYSALVKTSKQAIYFSSLSTNTLETPFSCYKKTLETALKCALGEEPAYSQQQLAANANCSPQTQSCSL